MHLNPHCHDQGYHRRYEYEWHRFSTLSALSMLSLHCSGVNLKTLLPKLTRLVLSHTAKSEAREAEWLSNSYTAPASY